MTVHAFVPAYDSCTQANQNLANILFPNNHNIVHGEFATREAFWELVRLNSSIFAMSHGDERNLYAQGGEESAISLADIKLDKDLILDKNLFIWACRTSEHLGKTFRTANQSRKPKGIWWGYPKTVSSPDKKVFKDFIDVFCFVIAEFPKIKKSDDVNSFIIGLRSICRPIYQRLIKESKSSRKYFGLYQTAVGFREMCEYLEVSFPNGYMLSGRSTLSEEEIWQE